MPAPNAHDKYFENKILYAPKEELTLMLYDGALKFCNQAIAAIEKKDVQGAHVFIMKTQDIIREFQISLNKKYPVWESFNVMYEYMYGRLVEANMKKDVAILGEVRDLIREFRDTWKEAMTIAKKERSAK